MRVEGRGWEYCCEEDTGYVEELSKIRHGMIWDGKVGEKMK